MSRLTTEPDPGVINSTIKIVSYYKYVFVIEAKLRDGRTVRVTYGGDDSDIYRFNPYGGWDHWRGGQIEIEEETTTTNQVGEQPVQKNNTENPENTDADEVELDAVREEMMHNILTLLNQREQLGELRDL